MKILFVCHGNICRSPMAEFVMKQMISDAGITAGWEIASAATSCEELGNPVYPPVRQLLNATGIDCRGKYARQMREKDYGYFDMIIGMDNANIRNILRICGGDPQEKVSRLLDHTGIPGEVADPWYNGNFARTWEEINSGCRALLEKLL